jgi:hypothetical protein
VRKQGSDLAAHFGVNECVSANLLLTCLHVENEDAFRKLFWSSERLQ